MSGKVFCWFMLLLISAIVFVPTILPVDRTG